MGYKEFVKNFEAKSVKEFQEARAKGLDYVVKTYLKKYEWSPGGHIDYVIENKKLNRNRSIIKILLELGLVVRRDCESGMIYIESKEIKN